MIEVKIHCEESGCGRKTHGLVKTLGDPFECPGCNILTTNYITVSEYEKQVREGKIY